tara:strand:+ start:1997 stop:2401 length:405 start_codon:yes stop_codon:yes gene_type:complete
MNIEEVLIGKEISEEQLSHDLAYVFHILPEEIAIVPEITGEEDFSVLKIVCQYEDIEGEFKVRLHLFGVNVQDHSIFLDLMKKLAVHLGCLCLTPDGDSMSPYDVICVDPKGEVVETRLSQSAYAKQQFVLERA